MADINTTALQAATGNVHDINFERKMETVDRTLSVIRASRVSRNIEVPVPSVITVSIRHNQSVGDVQPQTLKASLDELKPEDVIPTINVDESLKVYNQFNDNNGEYKAYAYPDNRAHQGLLSYFVPSGSVPQGLVLVEGTTDTYRMVAGGAEFRKNGQGWCC